MSFSLEAFTLGLILCADSFSAAVAMGCRRFTTKDLLKFAFASGGAESLATLAGFYAGANLLSLISDYDHWIAFALLLGVALHMAWEGIEGLRKGAVCEEGVGFHSFGKILVVSFATSMDAFGVGVGLGVANKVVAPFVVSIFAWAFVSTIAGLYLGNKISQKMGPIFTLLAALVLGYMSIEMLSI